MATPDYGSTARTGHSDRLSTSPLVTGSGSHVAHTLTACCRCRQRKTRCDANLPRCGPCERNDAFCEYFDASKGRRMPRSYVVKLQSRVQELENELAKLQAPSDTVSPELLIRGAGLVKIHENGQPSYLGPSSGINMTRLLLELAKGIRKTKKIKDLVPEFQARRIRERYQSEARRPSSKVYPMISSVPAPVLPSLALTNLLVETFFRKGQYLYPLLHEPSFRRLVLNVYGGSQDAYENFALRMVIALSLNSQWAGLADSYYLAALPYLEATVRRRDLGTLQSFMLIAQYSLVTPTRTAANWIVLLSVKLCQELGITEERTINVDSSGNALNCLEVDMRRRCYWICFAMEHGLAHSMGRPNAFGTSRNAIDVAWFQAIDDEYITESGIMPATFSTKKRIARHFISMRLLQLEIRRTLYLKHRPSPVDDMDPWFLSMEEKLGEWIRAVPLGDDGTAYNKEWFKARHNTIVVFLFRPSPQIPEPSVRAARKAFQASRENIETQRRQIDEQRIDLSWVFCQSIFMAINAVLWAISYGDIRAECPRDMVNRLLAEALETAYYCSLKWPGVEGAIELYGTLSHACLKAYDGDSSKSYNLASPIYHSSPSYTDTPDPSSPPFSLDGNFQHNLQLDRASSPSGGSAGSPNLAPPRTPLNRGTTYEDDVSISSNHSKERPDSAWGHVGSENGFEIFGNPLPLAETSGAGSLSPESLYSSGFSNLTPLFNDGPLRMPVAAWAPSQPMPALNIQQQAELMRELEMGQMDELFG